MAPGTQRLRFLSTALTLLFGLSAPLGGQSQKPRVLISPTEGVPLSELVHAMQEKAKSLESSSGMRLAFQSFTASHHLSPDSVRYSDFILVRLFFESTRDAGLWRQWRAVGKPSLWEPTATAECDELSALFAFLVRRAGVKKCGSVLAVFKSYRRGLDAASIHSDPFTLIDFHLFC